MHAEPGDTSIAPNFQNIVLNIHANFPRKFVKGLDRTASKNKAKLDLLANFLDIGKSTGPLGPGPVKTVEDPWKPLLCRSSCPVKNSCREPLYGDSYVEKIILGPVKVLEDQ